MESILKYNDKNLHENLLKTINYREKNGNLPLFRAKQILSQVYKKFTLSFDNMTDLPKELRSELNENYIISSLSIEKILESSDSETKKYLFKTRENDFIEAVRIEHPNRSTVCISSMVGCPLGCTFCATASMKQRRNLTVDEIVSQILILYAEKPFHNIVLMGMGEPLLNIDNVFSAISLISDETMMNFSPRRFTISTAGIIKGIETLLTFGKRINLAVSLNSPFQEEREELMPVAKSNPLNELFNVLKKYNKKHSRFTFEYVVIPGINNTKNHAQKIIELKKNMDFNLNLIRFNKFEGCNYSSCSKDELNKFLSYFKNINIEVVERLSKGSDINAGCGQLALKNN